MKQFGNYSEQTYAFLRIVVGLLFAFHGAQKLFGFLSEHPSPAIGSQVWIGGIIEFVCGALVMSGVLLISIKPRIQPGPKHQGQAAK